MFEKDRILALLEKGKVTGEEAARLYELLTDNDDDGDAAPPRPAAAPLNPAMRSKKLRVVVDIEGEHKVKVNAAVPLALARIADGIITNVIPKEVSKELAAQGIDLGSLNLGEIVDALTETDEDIANIDIDGEDTVKVRVYVE